MGWENPLRIYREVKWELTSAGVRAVQSVGHCRGEAAPADLTKNLSRISHMPPAAMDAGVPGMCWGERGGLWGSEVGWQKLSWLGTAEPCSSCPQSNHSFTQWVPAVIRALEAAQIYANSVPAGTKPKENGRCLPICPSIHITYRPGPKRRSHGS